MSRHRACTHHCPLLRPLPGWYRVIVCFGLLLASCPASTTSLSSDDTRHQRRNLHHGRPWHCRGQRVSSSHHQCLRSSRLLMSQVMSRRYSSCEIVMRQSFVPTLALPLIDPDDKWGNWGVLLGCASASQVLGTTTQLGRLLGPPVTAMAVAFGLASTGIINPGGTMAGKEMQLLALQLATPLILIGASSNLSRKSARQCGPLLTSFLLASAATVGACLVGWAVVGSSLTSAMGRDGLVIAAALLAKNIGGGINYVAVCNSLQANPTAVAAGLCVDNIFALVYFPATSMLAAGRPDVPDDFRNETFSSECNTDKSISVQGVSNVLFLSASLLWLSEKLHGGLPLCTLLTLAVTGLAPRSWLRTLQPSADCLGTVALYIFFATAGAPGLAVADSVKSAIFPLSAFLTCLYSIHGLVLYLSHKLLFKRNMEPSLLPQRLLVASSAAIGGPATAIALAQAAKWDSLKLPSLIVGNVGYAIATFCGLVYYKLLFQA